MVNRASLDDLISLCKRRGFLYQGSEIYGGLAGTWDWGPLGVQLKRNLMEVWWRMFVEQRADIYGLESAILMNAQVWQASGHLEGFVDLLVEDTVTKERFRIDHLLEEQGIEGADLTITTAAALIEKHQLKSPQGNALSMPQAFNMMFQTQIGADAQQAQKSYLRPETAQGIFVNFKNVLDSCQPDLPFGIAQMGKSFRNEISPRDFIFRSREFEQMEVEYFCRVEEWPELFEVWRQDSYRWFEQIGLDLSLISELDVPESQRAHYSQKTIDFEFQFAFGKKELFGLAYRGDFDLKQHQKLSGKSLEYIDKQSKRKFLPVCIEPSFGVERTVLALLQSVYRKDEKNQRIYLAFPPQIAPCQYAVSPLVANKQELVLKARQVFEILQSKYGRVAWDDHSNIGKRYRRQDEIGTPWCIVIDFQTLEDGTVTRRDRDTLEQVRLAVDEI